MFLNKVSEDDLEKEQKTEGDGYQVEKVMIWTERQATLRQVSQIGTSACGPTAVINVLVSLCLGSYLHNFHIIIFFNDFTKFAELFLYCVGINIFYLIYILKKYFFYVGKERY